MTSFDAAPALWVRKQLKWAVRFQRGHDLPDDSRREGSVPVFAGGGVSGWHDEYCAEPPGIVTGRYGTIGEFHLVLTPYWPLNTALYSIDFFGNHPGFLRYLLEHIAPLFHVHAGKSAVPGVDRNDVHTIPVALPRPLVQERIARALDEETGRIDALLVAKQRVLDLLAEKRKAIIATAVTRGLEPEVKLRDSGVPWLGEIPAHWEIERARWLFRERDVRSTTGEEEMLTVSHLTGVTPRSERDVNMFEAESNEGYKLCEPGDLVINTLWAWMGAMGTAPLKGIVSPAYNVYEPGPRLAPAYIDALVRLPVFAQEVTRYSKGVWSSRLRLYPEGFFEVYLPVPPRDEQRAIVAHITHETAKIDAVRAATERTIALLKERRAALIAAAVTGQLDLEAAA